MVLSRRTLLSTLTALLVACSADKLLAPPENFSHAAAASVCGGAGPAVLIMLSPDDWGSMKPFTPFVQIHIATPTVEALAGRTWTDLTGSNPDASASLQTSDVIIERATAGYLTVNSVGADKTISGTVDITFANGEHVHGGFRTNWLGAWSVCPIG